MHTRFVSADDVLEVMHTPFLASARRVARIAYALVTEMFRLANG